MTFRVSSSIANFKDKLSRRVVADYWHWWRSRNKPATFFGAYHVGDYVRILWHRGPRKIFWCGADCLNLKTSIWRAVIRRIEATHYCENDVERRALKRLGIDASVAPMIFDVFDEGTHFTPSRMPHVYLCAHEGRRKEYGVDVIERIAPQVPEVTFHIYGVRREKEKAPNVIFHGKVSNEEFTRHIKKYHAGLRLNRFDGFAEVTAKSILLGQYPITRIPFPFINCASTDAELVTLLQKLKHKKKPNTEVKRYWVSKLEQSLCDVL